MILEELGCRTTCVRSAEEALSAFKDGKFDIVVTDYRMPGMDGQELIQSLRGIDPELPIILLSGFADAMGLTERSTGASVVIMKSANEVSHLVRAVNRFSGVSRPRRKPAGSVPGKSVRSVSSSS